MTPTNPPQTLQPPRQGIRLHRRVFLITGGSLIASILACGGLATVVTQPQALDYRQSHCGADSMTTLTPNNRNIAAPQKVLVTYASLAGSTAEIAQAIAAQLCTRGFVVDVAPIDDVRDLAGYQRVVVGSAIRMGQWLPAALNFVETHQAELSAMPAAFFTVHLQNLGDDATSRQNRATYIAPVHALLTPAQEAFFAGAMDFARLTWIDKIIAKMVGSTEVDQRDWQAIRTWADEVALS